MDAWKRLPTTDDPRPWRRLACAMLLGGALGAYEKDPDDLAWVQSDTARKLADLVDLPDWPPKPEQLAAIGGRQNLQRLAHLSRESDGRDLPAERDERNRLIRALHRKGMTQAQIAERVGLARTTISMIVRAGD